MKIVNKKSIIWTFVIIIAIILIICIIWPSIKESKVKAENEAEIQALRKTPAAEYCQSNGGILEIKTDSLTNTYGICNFKDGSSCEILEYFRGECLSTTEKNEKDEENEENGEPEDLSTWIESMNNMEDINEEVIEDNDLDENDIDILYDYYENEFSNTGNKNREQPMGELKRGENAEDQLLSACKKVGGEVLGEKCYLSNGIEIAF